MTANGRALRRSGSSLALALALAACGDDSSDADSNASNASGTESSASTSSSSADSGETGSATGGASSSADASTSVSTGIATGTTDTGETTGGGEDVCSETDGPCGDGESCRVAACCRGVGYCVSVEAPSCGGFVGKQCPDALVCLLDWCVGDGDGRCVDAETAAALQGEYPGCWNGP